MDSATVASALGSITEPGLPASVGEAVQAHLPPLLALMQARGGAWPPSVQLVPRQLVLTLGERGVLWLSATLDGEDWAVHAQVHRLTGSGPAHSLSTRHHSPLASSELPAASTSEAGQ